MLGPALQLLPSRWPLAMSKRVSSPWNEPIQNELPSGSRTAKREAVLPRRGFS